MEKLQYRLWITAQWDWDMVPSRGDTPGMEGIRTGFPSVDPWPASVVAQHLAFR